MIRLCLIPKLSGTGGPVSFQGKLSAGLQRCGVEVCYDLQDLPYDAVLVIAGTRQLSGLRKVRQRGVRVVHRLDGMNWLHRKQKTPLRLFLRSEINNRLVAGIRRHLADRIVYQSRFVQEWWQGCCGDPGVPSTVIYNGIDLTRYTPEGEHQRPQERSQMLLVEGSLAGGQEVGLGNALRVAEILQFEHGTPMEVVVAGKVTPRQQADWQGRTRIPLTLMGVVPHEKIPYLDRSAHFYYSAEINPPCPNAVVEALACGLPVAGFATGSLPELVSEEAGRLVPYGGDPWKLDPPDIPALATAVIEILRNQATFRTGARRRAEEAFDLEKMVAGYLEVLLG